MSSPNNSYTQRAATHPSPRHLSPNPSTSTFEYRGRSNSTVLTTGRKGYNDARSTSASPSPPQSRLSVSGQGRPHSRSNSSSSFSYRSIFADTARRSRSQSDGLSGRKGYNEGLEGRKGYNGDTGVEGRKGYNDGTEGRKGYNDNGSTSSSREPSRSRSREPRHQGLGSKFFPAMTSPLNPAYENAPMERNRSDSGVNGRKGYNENSRSGSISGQGSSSRNASPRPDTHEGLTGRKGYNGSPQPSPLLPTTGTGSATPSPRNDSHGGLGGRKGYNGSPQPQPSGHGSSGSSPRPDHRDRDGLGGRKGFNASPQIDGGEKMERGGSNGGERRGSHVEDEVEQKERKNSGLGLGILSMARTYGGLGSGRKGYNVPRGSSPGQ